MTALHVLEEHDFGTKHLLDGAGIPLCGCSFGFLTADIGRCNCPTCFERLEDEGVLLYGVSLSELGH